MKLGGNQPTQLDGPDIPARMKITHLANPKNLAPPGNLRCEHRALCHLGAPTYTRDQRHRNASRIQEGIWNLDLYRHHWAMIHISKAHQTNIPSGKEKLKSWTFLRSEFCPLGPWMTILWTFYLNRMYISIGNFSLSTLPHQCRIP